jgi:hypothetical protein
LTDPISPCAFYDTFSPADSGRPADWDSGLNYSWQKELVVDWRGAGFSFILKRLNLVASLNLLETRIMDTNHGLCQSTCERNGGLDLELTEVSSDPIVLSFGSLPSACSIAASKLDPDGAGF